MLPLKCQVCKKELAIISQARAVCTVIKLIWPTEDFSFSTFVFFFLAVSAQIKLIDKISKGDNSSEWVVMYFLNYYYSRYSALLKLKRKGLKNELNTLMFISFVWNLKYPLSEVSYWQCFYYDSIVVLITYIYRFIVT